MVPRVMSSDLVFWIIAMICFIVAAFGTYTGRTHLIALGWVGLALGALTFITS